MVQMQWKQDEESSFSILYNSVEVVVDSQTPDSRRTLSTTHDGKSQIRPLRLSVLGAKSVGKTAIIVRYLTRRFIGEYRSQVDISYRHIVSIDDQRKQVDIFDFSPKTEEALMPQAEVSSSDCFLVVFNIADRVTFLKAVNVVSVLRSLPSAQSTPLTLLGNKRDLEHARQVSIEELQNISSLLKCDYSEVSAAESREEIVPIIFNLLKRVLSPPSPPNPSSFLPQSIVVQFKVGSNSEPCLCQDSPESCIQEGFEPQTPKKILHSKKLSVPEMEIEQYIVDHNRNYEKENKHLSTTPNSCTFSSEKSTQRTSSFVRGSSPCRTSGGKVQELPFKKIRISQHPPIARTKSLQGKERRSKSETKSKPKKVAKLNSFTMPEQCSPTDQRISCEIKKDSKISSFLNCSKSSDDQETSSYSPGGSSRDTPQKGESGSIASLFLRGRSFSHEDSLSTSCSSSEKKTAPTRSRKTLPSRFMSESDAKSNELKKHSHPLLDSPKPPVGPHKRDTKTLQDPRLPIAKPAFGDFSNARSYTTLDTMFQAKKTLTDEVPEQAQCKSPEKRERKFGVFGKSVLGSVFSKTSLPDLPRATASFYTKIDSIKKTIQKRSI